MSARAPFVPLPAAYVAGWPAEQLARFLVRNQGGVEDWLDEVGVPEASRAGIRATVDAIRAAAAASAAARDGTSAGTASGRPRVTPPPSGASDTTQAARVLGIGTRAVTKRIAAGTLPATKQAGRWWVQLPPNDEKDENVQR